MADPIAVASLINPFCEGQWLMSTAAVDVVNMADSASTSTKPVGVLGITPISTPWCRAICIAGITFEAYSAPDTKMREPAGMRPECTRAAKPRSHADVADSTSEI